MSCPDCGSMDAMFVPGHRARSDEPASVDGWECLRCGTWREDEFDARADMLADWEFTDLNEGVLT